MGQWFENALFLAWRKVDWSFDTSNILTLAQKDLANLSI